ncbi:hypothetical protein JM93_01846 [Roseibium hamelinense]|uniref:Uncharacterized protein n=1 Tax=Roseibium hamelinense TaxID=150831 RepID=A0A562T7N0_9HYPH|nr:hypothetical protein [Roseibium hamelinense]MTI43565.1 hypothetical protein [Roseibium hamelinense]TWI89641.1 hypothetical protein JM93_01846 [Roseibium hamelinense]
MSKMERTVVLVAGVLVGLMLLPVFFTIGLMVIGVSFFAAVVATLARTIDGWRKRKVLAEDEQAVSTPA